MNSKKFNRRQLLLAATSVSLAGLVPTSVAQQPDSIPADDAGQIHGNTLDTIASHLENKIINTEEGMFTILKLLETAQVVKDNDVSALSNLVKALFHSEGREKLQKNIEEIWNKEHENLSNVATAIFSIARQSIKTVMKYATDQSRQIHIVASDVLGAMTGGLACAKLGPIGIVIGVIAGSVGTSARAAFDTRR